MYTYTYLYICVIHICIYIYIYINIYIYTSYINTYIRICAYRICVALSRARHGMYVIGNFSMMPGTLYTSRLIFKSFLVMIVILCNRFLLIQFPIVFILYILY
jgi:hypothetical protein